MRISLCTFSSVALVALMAVGGCTNSPTAPTTAALSSLALSSSTVLGGASVTGTVVLATAAPAAGVSVALVSSNAAVTVPATVTVASGSTTATFTITTASSTRTTVTITATYLATSQTATLTTLPALALQGVFLSLAQSSVTAGSAVTGTVTLPVAAAADVVVSLASSSPAASVPASLTVPAGATSQTFEIDTVDSQAATTVTITATYSGVVQTATLTIARLTLQSLTLTERSVPGGLPVLGIITLSVGAPANGVSVSLASSNGTDAAVPASVTVAPGSTTQTFEIDTVNSPPTTAATITATYAGTSRTATLTVIAYPIVSSVSCSSTNPTGGTSADCAGTLANPAPAGGWQFALSSSDPSATVPASVTVPESGVTFQFTVTTSPVDSLIPVLIQIADAQSGLPLFTEAMGVTNLTSSLRRSR